MRARTSCGSGSGASLHAQPARAEARGAQRGRVLWIELPCIEAGGRRRGQRSPLSHRSPNGGDTKRSSVRCGSPSRAASWSRSTRCPRRRSLAQCARRRARGAVRAGGAALGDARRCRRCAPKGPRGRARCPRASARARRQRGWPRCLHKARAWRRAGPPCARSLPSPQSDGRFHARVGEHARVSCAPDPAHGALTREVSADRGRGLGVEPVGGDEQGEHTAGPQPTCAEGPEEMMQVRVLAVPRAPRLVVPLSERPEDARVPCLSQIGRVCDDDVRPAFAHQRGGREVTRGRGAVRPCLRAGGRVAAPAERERVGVAEVKRGVLTGARWARPHGLHVQGVELCAHACVTRGSQSAGASNAPTPAAGSATVSCSPRTCAAAARHNCSANAGGVKTRPGARTVTCGCAGAALRWR